MKVMTANLVTSITASTANANYPVTNLQDTHPKKLWKATAAVATLTVEINTGATGFALFNTNATGVSFSLVDPNAIGWEAGTSWEPGVNWANSDWPVTEVTNLDGVSGACLCEWAAVSSRVFLIISLTNENGDNVQAGVAIAGKLLAYNGPEYGLGEACKDYSIVDELSNGSVYVKSRDVVRVFSCNLNVVRDVAFHDFVFLVAKVVKSAPTAWLITDLNNSRWLAYARISKMVDGDHYTANRTEMNFELTEVI